MLETADEWTKLEGWSQGGEERLEMWIFEKPLLEQKLGERYTEYQWEARTVGIWSCEYTV